MLEKLGYQVTAMTSSVVALAAFLEQPDSFDMVISDQTMPDLTGVDPETASGFADHSLHRLQQPYFR